MSTIHRALSPLASSSLKVFRPRCISRTLMSQSQNYRTFATKRTAIQHGMETVYSSEAVYPIGPYSQAIRAQGWVFLSGQIPADSSGALIEGTVAEKAHRMFQNASAVLQAAGSSLDKAVKVNVYFQNFDDFKELNEVYVQYFPHKPARNACEVNKNPAGASFAMDVVAIQ